MYALKRKTADCFSTPNCARILSQTQFSFPFWRCTSNPCPNYRYFVSIRKRRGRKRAKETSNAFWAPQKEDRGRSYNNTIVVVEQIVPGWNWSWQFVLGDQVSRLQFPPSFVCFLACFARALASIWILRTFPLACLCQKSVGSLKASYYIWDKIAEIISCRIRFFFFIPTI